MLFCRVAGAPLLAPAGGPVGLAGPKKMEAIRMWHLIEDFFEQGIVVKLFILLGWLCVAIMVASFISAFVV